MTDTTLRHPRQPRGRAAASRPVPFRGTSVRERSLVLRGALAAAWAALAGLVLAELVVVILWAADSRSGTGANAAARSGLVLWSLAHHGDVVLNAGAGAGVAGRIGTAPLGLLLIPLYFTRRAGRSLATTEVRVGHLLGVALSVALPYAAFAFGLALLGKQAGFHAAAVGTAVGGFLLALVGTAWGAGRAAITAVWSDRLPAGVRSALVGALGALAVLVGAGAALVGLSLAVHAQVANEVAHAVAPGVAGGFGLWLLSAAFLPNAAVWGLALCTGPGFAIGVGTSITINGAVVGGVPALPLLAALPGSGVAPAAFHALLAAPLLAGVLAGLLVTRRMPGLSPRAVAGWAALAGPFVGACAALLAALSGGAAGPGRLATAGPSAWQVGMAVAEEVAALAAITAALLRWRALRGGPHR